MVHTNITDIPTYLRTFSNELGERILESFPPFQGAQDPTSPLLAKLLRRPYLPQAVVVGGIVRRLAEARSAAVVAECGTGKTLLSRKIFVNARLKGHLALACFQAMRWSWELICTGRVRSGATAAVC